MPSILVVEDSLPIALILERHLRGAGYHVTLAHDGAGALDQMARATPDCILLDLMMPVLTGIELLHQLRRDPAMASIPVVVVSALFYLVNHPQILNGWWRDVMDGRWHIASPPFAGSGFCQF